MNDLRAAPRSAAAVTAPDVSAHRPRHPGALRCPVSDGIDESEHCARNVRIGRTASNLTTVRDALPQTIGLVKAGERNGYDSAIKGAWIFPSLHGEL